MTDFCLGAAVMVLVAWLLLFAPVVPTRARAVRRGAANLDILKEQLASLNREAAAGEIDARELAASRRDVERRVHEDAGLEDEPKPASPASAVVAHGTSGLPPMARCGLGVAVAVFAIAAYAFLGNPRALRTAEVPATLARSDSPESSSAEQMPSQLDDMVARMLQQPPGTVDASGWAMVARSYAAMERHEDASRAYALAIALAPGDKQLISEQARTMTALRRGHAVPPETTGPVRVVRGTVSVAPALADRVRPGDTVFVVAREAGAAGPPLAAARYSAVELPIAFQLDDSNAPMQGARRLSQAGTLIVSARISRTGDAMPQPGDLRGDSGPIDPADGAVAVTIGSTQIVDGR